MGMEKGWIGERWCSDSASVALNRPYLRWPMLPAKSAGGRLSKV